MNLTKYPLAILIFLFSMTFWSCEDKLDYYQPIGEGESLIEATLDFEPTVVDLGKSRTAGNTIQEINKLAIAVYNPDGTLFKLFNDGDLTYTTSQTPATEEATDDNATAKATATAKLTLPFGRYRMYAIANLDYDLDESDIANVDDLKAISCTWDFDDISKNAQMFGYFTNDENRNSSGFEAAQPVTVSDKTLKLHAWVKRLASKVTVAYDGEGLHDGISVYIHNVSIRQIPLTCKLGEDNEPGEGEVSTDGFHVSATDTEKIKPSQVLWYNSKGVLTDQNAIDNAIKNLEDQADHELGLWVANGRGIQGAYGPAKDTTHPAHSPLAPALFFYENMQGVHKDKPKNQQHENVGQNVGPNNEELPDGYTSEDYKDEVPYGTFIEVEAYYEANTTVSTGEGLEPYVSNGPITYRFMLGLNAEDNYNALRNHHYKVTLGFKGYANQPDWHIEYNEETPEIYAPDIYVPYLYNQSVNFPMRFNGDLKGFKMEIIENNWAPYDANSKDGAPESVEFPGTPDWGDRVTPFIWNRACYLNSGEFTKEMPENLVGQAASSNYLYGRHKSKYCKLKDGVENTDDPYYVTPIWVGFLRLRQPSEYDDAEKKLPMSLMASTSEERYDNGALREALRGYYQGNGQQYTFGANAYNNELNLGERIFGDFTETSASTVQSEQLKTTDNFEGRNSIKVDDETINGQESKTVTVKLWTQPKTMGFISGFSGNNPYDSYPRKAVIRITAQFADEKAPDGIKTVMKDVQVLQSRRLINPKGVWRESGSNKSFNFILYQSVDANTGVFTALESDGAWSAEVSAGKGNILINNTDKTTGKTGSEVKFTVTFAATAPDNCQGIIDVYYHGNNCIHKFFVRRGYEPQEIVDGGAKWSSFSVYSFDKNPDTGEYPDYKAQGTVNATLTKSPLALGSMFKKGNYAEGILISNNETYPPLTALIIPDEKKDGKLKLTKVDDEGKNEEKTWSEINGISRTEVINNEIPTAWGNETDETKNWEWADVKVGDTTYRFPTYDDFQALVDGADIGVGVVYGQAASAPAESQKIAFGYFNPGNYSDNDKEFQKELLDNAGMRGFIAYNSSNANMVFFPIGTFGMGRRTMSNLNSPWKNYAGTLRYGTRNSVLSGTGDDQFRPIPYNIAYAPGVIYWLAKDQQAPDYGIKNSTTTYPGWDMNFFDINFAPMDHAISVGPGGDAIPIKLVKKD